MDALAQRMVMTLTAGEERTRFFGGLSLDPPFLGTRYQLVAWKRYRCGLGLSLRTADTWFRDRQRTARERLRPG